SRPDRGKPDSDDFQGGSGGGGGGGSLVRLDRTWGSVTVARAWVARAAANAMVHWCGVSVTAG
ncbi:MAG: hypothetical protein OXH24_01055, partial [Cyanobacteria bacterium MAG IRC3_bin_20]|nr:hypothetical protein [Cyanobacteria bacterium MAG IRC3_bin_20]